MNRKHIIYLPFFLIFIFLLASCATLSPNERRLNADELAFKAGFIKELVATQPFILTSYYRLQETGAPVRFYIEGDGYAWVTPTRPSGNPTPRNPVALQLAAKDPAPNVVYLARPCQFTSEDQNPACEEFYWTNGRFSEDVIRSMNAAVSHFVAQTQAKGIELVGYSGGGAVSVLIAARRNDILNLRTVAGNLDPDLVNRYHDVGPLDGSLDPVEVAPKIFSIPQLHLIGEKDSVIPFGVIESFSKKMGDSPCFHYQIIPGVSHGAGWVENWPRLLSSPISCSDE